MAELLLIIAACVIVGGLLFVWLLIWHVFTQQRFDRKLRVMRRDIVKRDLEEEGAE